MATLADYLSRVTPNFANQPDFTAFLTVVLQPLVDSQGVFRELLTTYDIDTAVGAQLDAVGLWVGRNRYVATPLAGVYFSFDTTGLGWDQGNWQGPFDPNTGLVALDDETFRALLKAKIIMNRWDGTPGMISQAVAELFGNITNLRIVIQDNQDMTMTVVLTGHMPSSVMLSLIQNGYVPIQPTGVGINYVTSSINGVAIFGFDVENGVVSGWDEGAWAGLPGVGPEAPTSLNVVTVTQTTASFTWLPPAKGSGPFTYQLEYQLVNGTGFPILAGPPVSTTSGSISNLAPGTSYNVDVYAINSTGSSDPSNVVTITTQGVAPAGVTGFQVSSSTATSVTLIWNAVVGSSVTYQVSYRLTETPPIAFAPFGSPTAATTVTIPNLTTGVSYDFQIYAISPFGNGPATTISATTAGTLPGLIQSLTVNQQNAADIVLTWGPPTTSNGPYNYVLQYAQNVTPVTYQVFTGTITIGTTIVSADVTNLQSNTAYLFRVYAQNSYGVGPTSDPVLGTTSSTSPSQVTNLVVSTTTTSAALTWNAATNAVTYQMQYRQAGSTTWLSAGSPVSTTSGSIAALASGTSYNFQVYGINANGVAGPPSVVVAANTAGVAPSAPGSVTTSAQTNNSITVSWTASTLGSGTILYQVSYRITGTTTFSPFGSYAASTSVVVAGLQSGVSYDFVVTAENQFGTATSAVVTGQTTDGSVSVQWNAADASPNITISNNNLTASAAPNPVTNFTGSATSQNSVSLTWTAPASSGYYGVRANQGYSTGKRYIEFTLNSVNSNLAVGVSTTAFNWSTSAGGLGSDAYGLGIWPAYGGVSSYSNNNTTSSLSGASDVAGDTVSLALDLDNKVFWYTTNAMRGTFGANSWNNNTTANPSTGVGGIALGLATATYYPTLNDAIGGFGCTINAGTSSFVIALPTGFSPWNGGGGGITTYPPGQVSAPTVTNTTYNSVSLSWAPPATTATAGSASSYKVSYFPNGSTVPAGAFITSATTITIDNLLPNANYTFSVQGQNSAGLGAASAQTVARTQTPAHATLTYRGVNLSGSDLTQISSVKTVFPHANAVIIPVYCTTANQTSTDVTLTVNTTTISSWVSSATSSGLTVFLAIYLSCRDGTPAQTITPGPSTTGVASFFANLQTVCVSAAQIGAQQGAKGLWCGVELAPWAGFSAGDTGPFAPIHVAQWQSIYNACKAVWPSGTIGYVANQTALGLAAPNSPFSANWSIWDAVVFNIFPGSSNTITAVSDFENYFDTKVDPNANVQAATGNTPLFLALSTYSNQLGRPIFINACGIIPADGNQAAPESQASLPPPYDFNMQSAWWSAVMSEVTKYVANIAGFFAFSAGLNTYSSPYTGPNYYGLQGLAAASNIDAAYTALNGSGTTAPLIAPTGLAVTSATNTSLTLSWSALAGSNINYVTEIGLHGTSSLTPQSPTTATSYTFNNLTSGTAYDMAVYATQGAAIGPQSIIITGTTTGTTTQSININAITAIPGQSFTVSGTFVGISTFPTVGYADDPTLPSVAGVIEDSATANSLTIEWQPVTSPVQSLPTGSTISTTGFSFTHPPMSAGPHTLVVEVNGTLSKSVTYTVASTASPNGTTVIAPSATPIVDAASNQYTITSGGQVAINGRADTTTTSVIELAWVNNVLWYQNGTTRLWYGRSSPTTAWTPTGGTYTSPIPYAGAARSLTISIPSSTAANQPFTITGTLSGYTSAPVLVYSDDGGSQNLLAGTITATSYSFSHPGLPVGSHSITITDTNDAASTATTAYTLSAQSAGKLISPLSVASPGVWQTSSVTANGVTTNYLYLLPQDYSTFYTYPLMIYLHQDNVTSISALQSQIDGWFNTAAFREAYPGIVVAPYLDQTNPLTPDWGGVTTTTSAAQNNAVQIIQTFQANYSVAQGRTFLVGSGAGACGGWDILIKYNRQTGTLNKLVDNFLSLGGAVFTHGFPGPNTATVNALVNVPIYCIHSNYTTDIGV